MRTDEIRSGAVDMEGRFPGEKGLGPLDLRREGGEGRRSYNSGPGVISPRPGMKRKSKRFAGKIMSSVWGMLDLRPAGDPRGTDQPLVGHLAERGLGQSICLRAPGSGL